eukprot:gene5292-6135_t
MITEGYHDPYFSYPENRKRNIPQTPSVFESFRDFESERAGYMKSNNNNQTQKQKALTKLFEPPLDILSYGPFQEVKQLAQTSQLNLLVNIQDSSVFDCQKLNRDTWSDKGLKNYIKDHFIFWQVNKDNPEGRLYCQLYHVEVFPHIAIIDGRTGMKKTNIEGFVDSNEAYKFYDEADPYEDDDNITEDEYSDEQIDLDDDPVDVEEEEDLEKYEAPKPPVLPAHIPAETIGTTGDCTIQIRMPDGEALKANFNSTDKIQMLYYFITVKKGINNFVLCTTFPRKELTGDILNKSLKEEELAPRAVLVLQMK